MSATDFSYVEARAAANANVRQHCSFGPLVVRLFSGSNTTLLSIDETGATLSKPAFPRDPDFTLSATPDAWAELGKPKPRPGFQTLFAMRRTQNLIVTGNMVKFLQHLMLLEMLFSNLGPDSPALAHPAEAALEPITGRYIRMNLEGRPHRVYFEEAGAADGIPLVCLHTAGSDSRQYRHLLNDSAITDRYRVIAFDLPWHGKSSPPPGFEQETYQLTTDRYMTTILAVCSSLKLKRPVVMGCSIGGRAVLHLAQRHPEQFRAVIGLQSALYVEDKSLGDPSPPNALHRSDVHGPKQAGASMAGLTAPTAPSAERWETIWHYMQGGPGIFAGDLHYHFVDGDLRGDAASGLRDTPCPVYLLTGEYDVSVPADMSREVADLVGAAHFEIMPDMGHFPMSENPVSFRHYILPVLEKIANL